MVKSVIKILNRMKTEFIKALEALSDTVTNAGMAMVYQEFTPEENEFYEVLMLCYDLLSRTAISQSIITKQDELMKDSDDDADYVRKFGIASSELADFTFALSTKKGQVSLRKLLRQITFNKTQKEIAEMADTYQSNISKYFSEKSEIQTDTWEKIVNAVLKSVLSDS